MKHWTEETGTERGYRLVIWVIIVFWAFALGVNLGRLGHIPASRCVSVEAKKE